MPRPTRSQKRRRRVLGVVVKKSRVHGRGVFATRPIRKGARIVEYTGRRVLWSSIPDDQDDVETYYFGLNNNKEVIDPSVGGNEAQWINHSCDPNCETIEDRCGRVMPFSQIRSPKTDPEWWQSLPAQFTAGSPVPRRHYRKFFDDAGIKLMESPGFPSERPAP